MSMKHYDAFVKEVETQVTTKSHMKLEELVSPGTLYQTYQQGCSTHTVAQFILRVGYYNNLVGGPAPIGFA